MKFVKLIHLSVLALTLSLGMAGCKKSTGKLTPLPGRGAGTVGDSGPSKAAVPDTAPPIRLDTGGAAGTGTGLNNPPSIGTEVGAGQPGIETSNKDFSNYEQNREKFRDQTVYFDFDKYNIKPSEISKLETVANEMKNLAGRALRIEGHCDERGTEEYNRALGERRALAIREKLASLGMSPDMIVTISFGEDQPTDPGHDESAWSKNRRGEIILLSPPGAAQ